MSILKISLAAAAAMFVASSAHAADLIIADPAIDMASPAGVEGHFGIIGSVGYDTAAFGGVGVVIGADVDLNDVFFVGGELRGMGYFNAGGYTGSEILVSGRLGFHVSDDFDLYGTGGIGYFAAVVPPSSVVYSLGVGAEFDVTEEMAVRLEVARDFGAAAATQVNLGLLWKF